jgi:enoyl-CoA hydratase/carnithine racemase
MSNLAQYQHTFANIHFERRDGILQMSLHTKGGPLLWGALADSVHAQLGEAFRLVGNDQENRVLILTGTGDAFCTGLNMDEMPQDPIGKVWPRMQREGVQLLMNLLQLEIPVIGAFNGPAYMHAEIVALSDIVLASDTTEIADLAHFVHGVVPSDGVHVVWPMLLGLNRGRYFLLTGQRLSAKEAHGLGVVAEVLPADRLLARAWELAVNIAAKPTHTLHYTRVAFTQHIKRRMHDELGYGLALEGLGLVAAQS